MRDFWCDTKGNINGAQLKLAVTNSRATEKAGGLKTAATNAKTTRFRDMFLAQGRVAAPRKAAASLFSAGLLPYHSAAAAASASVAG